MSVFKKISHGGHCSQGRVIVWGVLGWLCLFNVSAWGQFSGGSGTKVDPYLISTAADLQAIGLNSVYWGDHFKLTADLDLTGVAMTPIGNNTTKFTGAFNGNGRTIANLTIHLPVTDYVGLFGFVDNSFDPNAIFNLGLMNPDVIGDDFVGALAGWVGKGTLSGCYSEGGSVHGDRFVGGLVGVGGAISRSRASVDVSGNDNVGGLVGGSGGIISDCYATGTVTSNNSVGGLVGGSGGIISDCYATGTVTGFFEVGGLVGYNNDGTISNCYATGQVNGFFEVGGLVGNNDDGTIRNSYATGPVTGNDYVGGLVGINVGTIGNSYATGSVNGFFKVGGLVGENFGTVIDSFWDVDTSGQASSAGGLGKTTAQMKMESTFVCWGTLGLWTIDKGVEPPHLVWEGAPGTLIPVTPFLEGTGAPNDPYLINSASQLLWITCDSANWDKHYKLAADLDLTGVFMTPIGNNATKFTGTFNGNGYTLTNLTINLQVENFVGLFSYVNSAFDPTIYNLGLINPVITGNSLVGGLVGWLINGTVYGCYVDGGSVNGRSKVGGLVGRNDGTISECTAASTVTGTDRFIGGLVGGNSNSGTISNCTATGQVNGSFFVGGLAGRNRNSGTISNCTATGSVSGEGQIGGLVGENKDFGTISDCFATGDITVTIGNVGGLVGGSFGGTISDCYATGSVTGIDGVGGLVGVSFGGTISECYAAGAVSGNTVVGGLVGFISDGTISNSYATGVVNGTSRVGGLVGRNNNSTIRNCCSTGLVNNGISGTFVGGLVGNSNTIVFSSYWAIDSSGQGTSSGGIGKTLVEMKQAATFFGWGCDAVWTIDEGIDTPRLVWENAVGTLITNVPAYGGGSGTSNDPFLISTAQDLLDLSLTICDWDKHFELIFDPNMAGIVFTPIGNPVFPFTGTLDGNGHTIANLKINPGTNYVGLFGYVDNGVDPKTIFNLGLIDPDITGNGFVGAVIGRLINGSLDTCYVDGGSVNGSSNVGGLVGLNGTNGTISECTAAGAVTGTGQYVGGLVGENRDFGTISNCTATGQVNGSFYVGGLAGRNRNSGTISNCTATGSVSGERLIGGLVGLNNDDGTISNSYATGPVNGFLWVGGLLGFNNGGTISGCAASGQVSGDRYIGGLVGFIDNGTISGCTASGSVTGTNLNVGGLVGFIIDGTISNCTATGQVNGSFFVGGLVGYNNSGTISGCTATGLVDSTFGQVGGLVGRNLIGTISKSYATGTVDGIHNVGGLVGSIIVGTISDCYANGAVSGTSRVGGLVGRNESGTISSSYATGAVSGTTNVGGLVGSNSGAVNDSFWDTQTSGQVISAGGIGKTTAQMQTAATYLGARWDFVGEAANGVEDVWTICGGSDYPRFVWEIVTMEDLVCPDELQVWFTPRRFNPKSQGKWIRGHVIMPEGIEPADIDPANMVRLAPLGILSDEVEVMIDESGQVELAIAFNRAEVLAALEAEAENHSVGITLIGAFADGSSFYATGAISILKSRASQLNLIASHWLSEDCRARDWCGGADVNQDGIVNYLDFFLEPMDFIYIFAND